jgi:hypothetical protein
MWKWLVPLTLLALTLRMGAAAAADLAQTGPEASAAQIVAAHNASLGASQGDALKLVFDVSGGPYKTAATLSVELAGDYMLVRDSQSDAIYDYKLRRIFWLDPRRRTFGNTSLYAMADFRLAETEVRRRERAMLTAAKIDSAIDLLDPYWMQAELHVVDEALPAVARKDGADGAHFLYKSAEIASYALSGEPLGAAERALFAHLLEERTTLHPSTIAALLAEGRLPQRLSFATPPARKEETEVWTLRSVSRAPAAFPLEAGLTSAPAIPRNAAGGLALLGRLLPVMQDAVKGRAGNGPRSAADYRAALDAMAARREWFAALLTALEAQEQYGELPACGAGQSACVQMKDIVTSGDARVGDLARALQMEDSDRDGALALLKGISRAGISNAYVLDGFTGNALAGAGDMAQALPLLIAQVRGNPYVGGYYKDLGDLLRQSFEPDQAWLFYDLGRALPGGANAPVIATMNDYESKIAARAPQFF